MDTAVGLVQAYLRINGFFTVTEYPIIARSQAGGRMLTDMDILAVRFPGAQRWIPDAERHGEALPIDPRLADDDESMFMIIGEVKEGKAGFNDMAYSEQVLETAIRRFGCCTGDIPGTVGSLLSTGSADTRVGTGMPFKIRMLVFGTSEDGPRRRYEVISLGHVVTFLNHYLSAYRDVLLRADFKDESLRLMALLVKLGVEL